MNPIKKGDTVEVISGEHRGERGQVRTLMPKEGKVIISGINIVKRHQRPTGKVRTQAGIIEFEAPIFLSKVMLVCPRCSKKTGVSFNLRSDRKKVRVCKSCEETID